MDQTGVTVSPRATPVDTDARSRSGNGTWSAGRPAIQLASIVRSVMQRLGSGRVPTWQAVFIESWGLHGNRLSRLFNPYRHL
jgi:hypothetical protein